MERHKAETAKVIPINICHVNLDKTSPQQKSILDIQGLPRNNKPIEDWSSSDRTWAEVAGEIRKVCEDILTKGK